MERFVIIVSGFQPLTIITKRSILEGFLMFLGGIEKQYMAAMG